MFSETDFYNQALDRIGSTEVVRSEGDNSLELRLCSREFTPAKFRVLSLFGWGFARRRATLARVEEDPPFGYACAFRLPADFFCVVKFNPRSISRTTYTIEGNNLLTDATTAELVYTSREFEASSIPPHVAELVVIELARRILPGIKGAHASDTNALLEQLWRDAYPVAMQAEIRSAMSRPRAPQLVREYDYPPEFIPHLKR